MDDLCWGNEMTAEVHRSRFAVALDKIAAKSLKIIDNMWEKARKPTSSIHIFIHYLRSLFATDDGVCHWNKTITDCIHTQGLLRKIPYSRVFTHKLTQFTLTNVRILVYAAHYAEYSYALRIAHYADYYDPPCPLSSLGYGKLWFYPETWKTLNSKIALLELLHFIFKIRYKSFYITDFPSL